MTHIVWFYDGSHFRRADSSIYNSDGVIAENDRTVTFKNGKHLYFKGGKVLLDTLLIKKKISGTSGDSLLVMFKDTVRYITKDSLWNIYTKDDSIKSNRVVTLRGRNNKQINIYFKGGQFSLDTLLIRQRNKGTSRDSFLTRFKDTVRFVPYDSLWNIYTKDDSIKSNRVVTLRGRNNQQANIYFKGGQFSLDTLLIRKRNKGTSRDSFLVRFKDTVRYIPYDSLWNIYTKDDSIRNTKNSSGKRTVYLQSKKLVFALGKNGTTQTDTGKIGIGQTTPLYTLDVATATAAHENTNTNTNNSTTTNGNSDSIAVRISHNVTEGSSGTDDAKALTRYGLVITENSNKAYGRSALGFQNGGKVNNSDNPFMKARLWTQIGSEAKDSKFGIDVADSTKSLHTRMVINKNGFIGIDTVAPNSKLHILGKGRNFANGIVNIRNQNQDNYLRIQAGGTATNKSGLWMTEYNNTYGWALFNNAANDKFQLVKTNTTTTNNNTASQDTILDIKRNGATVLNTQTGSNTGNNNSNSSDSVALWIKHNTEDNKRSYGLMLDEGSNKATGRSSIGFRGGNGFDYTNGNNYVKSAIWAEVGSSLNNPKFGIDVANSAKRLHTRMVIDKDGKIGINVENPTSGFELNGNGIKYTNDSNVLFRVDNTNALMRIYNRNQDNYLKVESGGRMRKSGLWLTDSADATGWRIENESKTKFLNIIHTDKNALATGNQNNRTNVDTFMQFQTLGVTNTSGKKVIFKPSVTVLGTLTQTSDSSLKYQIKPYDVRDAVVVINKLNPVTYKFKSDTLNRLRHGFIAQEVEKILPNFVDSFYSNGVFYKSLDYQSMVVPIIANVQLLNKKNTQLEFDNQTLLQEVANLKAELLQIKTLIKELGIKQQTSSAAIE